MATENVSKFFSMIDENPAFEDSEVSCLKIVGESSPTKPARIGTNVDGGHATSISVRSPTIVATRILSKGDAAVVEAAFATIPEVIDYFFSSY
jgi:hypothetical protein